MQALGCPKAPPSPALHSPELPWMCKCYTAYVEGILGHGLVLCRFKSIHLLSLTLRAPVD